MSPTLHNRTGERQGAESLFKLLKRGEYGMPHPGKQKKRTRAASGKVVPKSATQVEMEGKRD